MWYSIYCEDVEDSLPIRKQTRPAHLERIQTLVDQGRSLVAGPNPAIDSDQSSEAGFTGSLIIAEFDSLTEAQEWANKDPYTVSGVFKKVTVKPYIKVLP